MPPSRARRRGRASPDAAARSGRAAIRRGKGEKARIVPFDSPLAQVHAVERRQYGSDRGLSIAQSGRVHRPLLDLLEARLAQQAPQAESEARVAAIGAPVQHRHLEEQRPFWGSRAATSAQDNPADALANAFYRGLGASTAGVTTAIRRRDAAIARALVAAGATADESEANAVWAATVISIAVGLVWIPIIAPRQSGLTS